MRNLLFASLFSILAMGVAQAKILIPLQAIPDTPFFLVEAQIGHFGKYKMLVDTGSSETVIADWVVQEKNIPTLTDAKTELSGTDEHSRLPKVEVSYIRIGTRLKHLKFMYSVPSPELFKKLGIGGILSPQKFFAGQDVLLDFPKKQILAGKLLRQLKHRPGLLGKSDLQACSSGSSDRYSTEAVINGVAGRFALHTGSAHNAVKPAFAEKFQAKPSRTDEIPVRVGRVKSQLKLSIDANAGVCPTVDGKIGNEFLKSYAVFLSSNRDELRLYK